MAKAAKVTNQSAESRWRKRGNVQYKIAEQLTVLPSSTPGLATCMMRAFSQTRIEKLTGSSVSEKEDLQLPLRSPLGQNAQQHKGDAPQMQLNECRWMPGDEHTGWKKSEAT